ncbi:MAG: hypothetical protein HY951_13285 [Bacteroidia bacterium]|nr:hypothetical protein [Bacteroidia bacterium]
MAMLESAIVIYLREHYYPDGFSFPLSLVTRTVAITEFFREAATLVMLVTIGYLTGRDFKERFACFIYAFAVWDIFYYVFLYVIIGWPSSLFTWDVLFLLPSMWTGPVIAPVLTSLNMILLSIGIIHFSERNKECNLSKIEWWLLVIGSLIVVGGFMQEFITYLNQYFSWLKLILNLFSHDVLILSMKFVPKNFPWLTYIVGQGLILITTFYYIFRNYKLSKIK